jgi:short-subunit dehydrogenase
MIGENIVITGASSGIGCSLSLAYAESGVSLALFGRNPTRLSEVAAKCRERGAAVRQFVADVTDEAIMREALLAFDHEHPVSLLIVSAGITSGVVLNGAPETVRTSLEVMRVNYDGALCTINPILPAMKARGRGHIAIIGSLAARPALPSSPAYSASKAALETYAYALAGSLRGSGVTVSIISPGYIESPMTDQVVGPKPFLMTADKAASIIKRELARKKLVIRFPWPLAWSATVAGLLPPWILFRMLDRLAFQIRPRG